MDTCWMRQGWKGHESTELTQQKEQSTLGGVERHGGGTGGGSERPDRIGHHVGPRKISQKGAWKRR